MGYKNYKEFPKELNLQSYRVPFVCMTCRKSFKKPKALEFSVCPQCSHPLVSLSRDFKAPPRTDDKQWKKVEYLVENGFKFQRLYTVSDSGYREEVPYPDSLIDAHEFVLKYKHLVD